MDKPEEDCLALVRGVHCVRLLLSQVRYIKTWVGFSHPIGNNQGDGYQPRELSGGLKWTRQTRIRMLYAPQMFREPKE